MGRIIGKNLLFFDSDNKKGEKIMPKTKTTQENILKLLEKKHPRRFKIAKRLVERLELNGYKNYGGNTWEKSLDRKEASFTLMIDGFERFWCHHPAWREGWSREKMKYTKKLFSTENCGMISL